MENFEPKKDKLYSVCMYIYSVYMWLVKKATESALPLGELDIQ